MLDNKVTGMQVYYYFVCIRKLWYFSNEICMENSSENVALGKILDETAYKRKNKHILIDDTINIDFISEHSIINEIKKSRKIEEAGIWQTKYYIYYLKNKGIDNLKGKIDYPLLKQSVMVELSDDDIETLELVIKDINKIIAMPLPPKTDRKNFCKSCAYYDLCFI